MTAASGWLVVLGGGRIISEERVGKGLDMAKNSSREQKEAMLDRQLVCHIGPNLIQLSDHYNISVSTKSLCG